MPTKSRGLLLLGSLCWVMACGPVRFHLGLPASTPNGTLTASPTEPSGGYAPGTRVALTASPNIHYALTHWTGTDDDGSTALTNEVTMSADKAVGVTFELVSQSAYLVTLVARGDVTLAVGTVAGQSGPSYTTGTVVPLQAQLGAAGHKVLWTGTDNDASTATTNTVTLESAPVTATATSACDTQCTLTVLVDSGVDGSVTVTDGTLSVTTSSDSTRVEINTGDTVTLTAHDGPGRPFQGWMDPATSTGACTGTIVLAGDQTVSASFPDSPESVARCRPPPGGL